MAINLSRFELVSVSAIDIPALSESYENIISWICFPCLKFQ